MSQNDVIALEANLRNWVNSRGQGLSNVDQFVYYCLEQLLKPFHLNDEEILYGITDAPNDGGVDAIYFLVNRRELVREETALDDTAVSKAHLIIAQVKTSGGFQMTEIEKLVFFTDDLLDLSRQVESVTTRYHPRLIQIMRSFKEKYLQLAGSFPEVSVDYYYVTKGDELSPDTKAADSADKVKQKVLEHLNKAQCSFNFVNLQRLLECVRQRPPRERILVWSESPMQTVNGYVGLAKLADFFDFIRDEHGDLAEHIFESNVRGFQQNTLVNVQIRQSLRTGKKADFWLLNNGVTVIATNTQTAGHKRLALEDPQIVNGLQTAREIFNYFREEQPQNEQRQILVKVIQTGDEMVRDAVIKATNSQNAMPAASLRATDPIHHQIEDLFKQYGWFYDRRKGFYKDNGKPIRKIVSVTELVQAVISVLLQRPDDARARPSDYIKDDARYEAVFGKDKIPLGAYLACVLLLRRVEDFLDSLDLEAGAKRNVKFYITAYLACVLTKALSPPVERVLPINPSSIEDGVLKDCYKRVWKRYEALSRKEERDTVARGTELLKRLRADIRRQLGAKQKQA